MKREAGAVMCVCVRETVVCRVVNVLAGTRTLCLPQHISSHLTGISQSVAYIHVGLWNFGKYYQKLGSYNVHKFHSNCCYSWEPC